MFEISLVKLLYFFPSVVREIIFFRLSFLLCSHFTSFSSINFLIKNVVVLLSLFIFFAISPMDISAFSDKRKSINPWEDTKLWLESILFVNSAVCVWILEISEITELTLYSIFF